MSRLSFLLHYFLSLSMKVPGREVRSVGDVIDVIGDARTGRWRRHRRRGFRRRCSPPRRGF